MKYYVDINAMQGGQGTQESPFGTIQAAADIALPGDEVIVLPGIYRENVDPKNSGTEDARIVYRSSEPLGAVITGAEVLTGWKKEDGIWTVRVCNDIFTERNPYATRVSGDWFMAEFIAHTGDVFLNGKSMYEADSVEAVKAAVPSSASWDKAFSVYQWYAVQGGNGLVSVGRGTDNGAVTLSSPRYTPYHIPHRTEIAGFMTFLHGDDRFYNNIFIQKPVRPVMNTLVNIMSRDNAAWDECNILTGTFVFDDYQNFEEWDREFEGYCGMGSPASDRYYIPLPVWSAGNVYYNGAKPWKKEMGAVVDIEQDIRIRVEECEDGWYLRTNLGDVDQPDSPAFVDTYLLGMAFEPEQKFENPDGTPIAFDTDYFGCKRMKVIAGPFADISDSAKKLW